MKKLFSLALIAGWIANCGNVNAAPPTSGPYIADPVNTYVKDQALEPIENVGNILCFIGSLRAESKIGAGNYNALVDIKKCEGKGESGNSSSAGASAATEYTKVVVNSTRSDSNSPMTMKAWISQVEDGDSQLIYAYTNVTKGASDSAPNGNLTLDFAGYRDATPNIRAFRGRLVTTDTAISFTEQDDAASFSRKLTLNQSSSQSGSGRISQVETGINQTYDVVFAYNSTHFTRKKGNDPQQCFSRSKDSADVSAWRYGVYQSDGSRLNLSNPGFTVTFTSGSNTYWGYAGYFGVHFPDDALTLMGSSATVTGNNGAASYTFAKVGGKLSKMTRGSTTLDAIKGIEIGWVWLNEQNGGAVYNLKWNGTNLVKTQVQGVNGDWVAVNNGVVSASDLRTLFQPTIFGYSQALGGQVTINVPSAADFVGSQSVYYRTTNTVSAADAANLTLICVSECLKKQSQMLASLPNIEPFEIVGNSTRNWSAVLASAAKKYVFNSGMMYLTDTTSGNQVDASSPLFTTSGNNPVLSGNYQWGVRTGMLVAAVDGSGTPPSAIRCDPNGNQNNLGTHICPQYFKDLTETYEWETGPHPWNQYATLTASGSNTPVSFDPPKRLNVTLSASNSTLSSSDEKIGSSLQLDYNGFGDLWGIPGSCYNPATNEKGPCDATTFTNWAPQFSLRAGAEVTETSGGTTRTYYVKPIDQEIRFAKVADSNCSSLTLPTSATLPSVPTGDDAKVIIGSQPTVTSAPAVIHGVVQ